MEDLKELRNRIDSIDIRVSKLLAERFEAAEKIGEVKRENGMQIVDYDRERDVLKNASACVPDSYKSSVENVFKTIISESKNLQK